MPAGGHGIERFREAVHIHGALHDGVQTGLAQRIRHTQAVDHSAQHAHLVRRDGIHVGRGALAAAPDVPGADDDADLRSHVVHGFDDSGDLVHLVKIKEIMVRFKGFAAEFQQDPFICSHNVLLSGVFLPFSIA